MTKKTCEILTISVFIAVLCQPLLAQGKPRAEIVSVDIPEDIISGQPVYVDVVVKNVGGDAKAGGISISFPDNPLVSIIYSDTTKATVYPTGSKIWSNIEKKNISSRYVLVEAWQEPWKSQDERRFKLKVMPNVVGKLRAYVRATVTVPAKRREIIKTPDVSMITDQQGFPVLSYEVEVSAKVATAMRVTINQIDASYYPDVICYVVVTDEADRPLSGLTKDNFSVSEGGVIQNISSVSSIALGRGGQPAPISVVLTVDKSGSMAEEGKMAAAVSAATKFIDLMRSDDKALIVGFSDDVMIYGSPSSSRPYLRNLVKSLTTGGRTALYDAVSISTDEVVKESGRKAVLALTDGIENQSKIRYEKMIEE
ncbi:MAG: VWA domain-containing protein, partial [Candidatus Poribacteria bacterium]